MATTSGDHRANQSDELSAINTHPRQIPVRGTVVPR